MKMLRKIVEFGLLCSLSYIYLAYTHKTPWEMINLYSTSEMDDLLMFYVYLFFGIPVAMSLLERVFDYHSYDVKIKDLPLIGSFFQTAIWSFSLLNLSIFIYGVIYLVMHSIFDINIIFIRGDFLLVIFFMSFIGIFVIWMLKDLISYISNMDGLRAKYMKLDLYSLINIIMYAGLAFNLMYIGSLFFDSNSDNGKIMVAALTPITIILILIFRYIKTKRVL